MIARKAHLFLCVERDERGEKTEKWPFVSTTLPPSTNLTLPPGFTPLFRRRTPPSTSHGALPVTKERDETRRDETRRDETRRDETR